jgi:hypothetical protein
LTGTEQPTFLRGRPGQLGQVYEWSLRPTWPGQHEYIFNVDSTIRCAVGSVDVRQALATPTPELPDTSFGDFFGGE